MIQVSESLNPREGKASFATVKKLGCVRHTERSPTSGRAGPSPGLVSPQESLVDVRFQEARVAVPGHQAVDELLRRVKGRQTRLAHVLRDVLSGAAVDVDLK